MNILQILKDIGPVLVVITFIKTAYEFIKGLKWKKSEYLYREIKDFFSNQDVKTVCTLLDYNVRKIQIDGSDCVVTDSLLESALQTHDNKQSFTIEEAKIRDLFDVFFDKLSYFNIHIQNDLVEKKQVLSYLSYYLQIISKPGRKPESLVKTFDSYIKYYQFENVEQLINLHKKSPKRTFFELLRNFGLNIKSIFFK